MIATVQGAPIYLDEEHYAAALDQLASALHDLRSQSPWPRQYTIILHPSHCLAPFETVMGCPIAANAISEAQRRHR